MYVRYVLIYSVSTGRGNLVFRPKMVKCACARPSVWARDPAHSGGERREHNEKRKKNV